MLLDFYCRMLGITYDDIKPTSTKNVVRFMLLTVWELLFSRSCRASCYFENHITYLSFLPTLPWIHLWANRYLQKWIMPFTLCRFKKHITVFYWIFYTLITKAWIFLLYCDTSLRLEFSSLDGMRCCKNQKFHFLY